MKAIKVTIYKEECLKIEPFIKSINENENLAAYQFDKTAFFLASTNECGISYATSCIAHKFEDYSIEIIK